MTTHRLGIGKVPFAVFSYTGGHMTKVTHARLVYQCGLANVFSDNRRILQHAYTVCEWYCSGLIAAGATVEVLHCDRTGDVLLWEAEWQPGPGDLWSDQKHPPGFRQVA